VVNTVSQFADPIRPVSNQSERELGIWEFATVSKLTTSLNQLIDIFLVPLSRHPMPTASIEDRFTEYESEQFHYVLGTGRIHSPALSLTNGTTANRFLDLVLPSVCCELPGVVFHSLCSQGPESLRQPRHILLKHRYDFEN